MAQPPDDAPATVIEGPANPVVSMEEPSTAGPPVATEEPSTDVSGGSAVRPGHVMARPAAMHIGDEEDAVLEEDLADGEEEDKALQEEAAEAAAAEAAEEEAAAEARGTRESGPLLSKQSTQRHGGDEGVIDVDFEEELNDQALRERRRDEARRAAAQEKEARQLKAYSNVILGEIQHGIDEVHLPQVQSILRQSVGWIPAMEHQEIDVDYLAVYLKKQEGENKNFIYLIRVTAFMVVFVVMVLLHEDMNAAGLLQRFIAKQIGNAAFEGVEETGGHKTLYDTDTKEDLWLFLKEVVMPIFVRDLHADMTSIDIHAVSELNRIMRYNVLIGGVHLLQRRYRARSCVEAFPGMGPEFNGTKPLLDGFTCFNAKDGEKMTDDCFGPLHNSVRQPYDRELLPAGFCADHSSEGLFPWSYGAESRRLIIGKSKRSPLSKPSSILWYTGLQEYDSDTYSVVFNTEDGGLAGALQRLDWLQSHDWIDLQTQYVGIRIFLLNPELAMYTHMSIGNFFGHSGEIVSMISMTTFRAEPYQVTSVIVADLVFALFLGYNVIELYVKFFNAVAKGHLAKWFRQSWNLVQGFFVHYGILVMLGWGFLCLQIIAVKEDILHLDDDTCRVNATRTKEYLESMDLNTTYDGELQPDDPIYTKCLMTLHDHIYEFSTNLRLYRVVLAIYCIVLIVRFFKVFMLQPRLATVVVTLQNAWDPLFHHMVVFLLNLGGFTVAGVLIFGRRNGDFATITIAFNTCFRMLFGDFDWTKLSKEHPLLIICWFWSFTWVCAMILVNMFMAIIMDVYTEVKQKAGFTHSMWGQQYMIFKLFLQARTWVSTSVVQRVLRETFQKPFIGRSVCAKIDADVLVQVIPGMTKMQADYIVQGALDLKANEDGIALSVMDAVKVIADIAVAVKKLNIQLVALVAEMHDEREDAIAEMQERKDRLAAEAQVVLAAREEAGMEQSTPHLACPAFARRAADLETRLQRIAEFAEDFTCWQAYRGKEVHERVCKIEALLTECSQFMPGRQFKSIEDIPRLEEEPPPPLLIGSRGNATENTLVMA